MSLLAKNDLRTSILPLQDWIRKPWRADCRRCELRVGAFPLGDLFAKPTSRCGPVVANWENLAPPAVSPGARFLLPPHHRERGDRGSCPASAGTESVVRQGVNRPFFA